jgi:hypothetical protein
VQHLSEKDTVASVKNGKTNDEHRVSDIRSGSKDKGDDSCEVVIPKLSKELQNINEVMTWLKQQTDNEHFHLLHLVNIKQYVLKKFSHEF